MISPPPSPTVLRISSAPDSRDPDTTLIADIPDLVVETRWRPPLTSPDAPALIRDAHTLGIHNLIALESRNLFFLWNVSDDIRQRLIALISDPALHDVTTGLTPYQALAYPAESLATDWVVDIVYRPGVLDPAGDGATQRLRRLFPGDWHLRTGKRYLLHGSLDLPLVNRLVAELLSNPLIQIAHCYQVSGPMTAAEWMTAFRTRPPAVSLCERISLAELDDVQLLTLSRDRRLALDLDEMQSIQAYFLAEGRSATDVELETLALAWSEHCSHKTFKASVEYTYVDSAGHQKTRTIKGILRELLMEPTRILARPWVTSAFVDNAGIMQFGASHEVAIKVETHNHPSALEPFGGAQTGVGGVIRDILGVSAHPIAVTDVLCFGPLDTPPDAVPRGTLHPLRVFRGVVGGVGDYGNKVGVPTVNGAVLFDPGYVANPLVFCGCLGIAPRGRPRGRPQPGDLVVVLGGRTGRDGLHGATFSSDTLDETSGSTLASAVQIGEPIVEKGLIDVLDRAAAAGMYRAITDCGAGGLCSAVGELADPSGVEVDLEKVPLKYAGLSAWEIWLSESQERMVLAAPPDDWPRLHELCRAEDVDVAVIGRFTADGAIRVRYQEIVVADLPAQVVHHGRPMRQMVARWVDPPADNSVQQTGTSSNGLAVDPAFSLSADANAILLQLLAHPTIASKESVVRSYDHEVQAATVGKPLLGGPSGGPTDGAVLRPLADTWRGIALACGINPLIGALDPYQMALHAIDEAMRNLVAVGGDPTHTGLLDNFCWGNPQHPEVLGSLVRAAEGCYDAALALGTPFISGKDSLYNEYTAADGQRLAIPGTLLITAVAPVPDVRHTISSALTMAGNLLYLVGVSGPELGGSHLAQVWGMAPSAVPPVDLTLARRLYRGLATAIGDGVVVACHDCSEGGLGVAVSEMALATGLGASIDLDALPLRNDANPVTLLSTLFGEAPTRWVVEVAADQSESFEGALAGLPVTPIGVVVGEPHLTMTQRGREVVSLTVAVLDAAWHQSLEPQTAIQRGKGARQ